MAKHEYLQVVRDLFKKQKLFARFRDNNSLEISLNNKSLPFAFLVIDDEQFHGIILSLTVEPIDASLIAELTVNLIHIAPLAMGETFYITRDGGCHWGDNAYKYLLLEKDSRLLDLEPVTDLRH